MRHSYVKASVLAVLLTALLRRATAADVTYGFAVSLSTRDVSTPGCFYCRQAEAGLELFQNFVSARQFLTRDGHRVRVELVKAADDGTLASVLANYEEFDRAGVAPVSGAPIAAWFGPAKAVFTAQVTQLAQRSHITVITWAFDTYIYFVAPGTERAFDPKVANINDALLEATESNRRLLASDFGDLVGDLADLGAKAEKARTAKRAVSRVEAGSTGLRRLERRSPVAAAPQQAQRRLQVEAYNPCLAGFYFTHPLYQYTCEDTRDSLVHEHFSTDLWDLEQSDTALVMVAPRGSRGIFLEIEPSDSDLIVGTLSRDLQDYGLQIWDENDTTCLFGTQRSWPPSRDAGGQPGVTCLQTGPDNGYCRNFWRLCMYLDGVNVSLANSTGMTQFVNITAIGGLPQAYRVKVFAKEAWIEDGDRGLLHVRLSQQYGITPCPLDVNAEGCEPCAPVCMSRGLWPTCEGYDLTCTEDPNPDGVIYEFGYTNYFDINIPPTGWAMHSISLVYQQGARSMVFTHYGRAEGEVYHGRHCETLRLYAEVLGSRADAYILEENQTFVQDMRVLEAGGYDVMVHCGTLPGVTRLVAGLKAYEIDLDAFIVDRPMGLPLVSAMKGFNTQYILEPLVMSYNSTASCPVFGSIGDVEDGVGALLPSLQRTGYAALQTAATGALLLQALQATAPYSDAEEMHNTLQTYLVQNVTQSFWGPMQFAPNGVRLNVDAGTRQFVPDRSEILSRTEQYELSALKVVDRDLARDCHGFGLGSASAEEQEADCDYVELLYPMPLWTEKEIGTYPCAPGCVFLQHTCQPCPEGTFRGADDIRCRPCLAGTTAPNIGMAACEACGPGGEVQDESKACAARADFYRVTSPGNFTEEDDLLYKEADGPECVSPYRTLNFDVFFACKPVSLCPGGTPDANVCKGSNTGAFCGQCDDGETATGWTAGRRQCNSCPPKAVTIVLLVVFLLFYYCVVIFLEGEALSAAVDPSTLTAALLRSMLQYLQILGIVLEVTRADADEVLSILGVPTSLLVRPLEALQFECLFRGSPSLKVKRFRQASLFMLPFCILGLLAVQIVKGLAHLAFNGAAVIASARRLRQKLQEKAAVAIGLDVEETDDEYESSSDEGVAEAKMIEDQKQQPQQPQQEQPQQEPHQQPQPQHQSGEGQQTRHSGHHGEHHGRQGDPHGHHSTPHALPADFQEGAGEHDLGERQGTDEGLDMKFYLEEEKMLEVGKKRGPTRKRVKSKEPKVKKPKVPHRRRLMAEAIRRGEAIEGVNGRGSIIRPGRNRNPIKYYCGQPLDQDRASRLFVICGPASGPQCAACERFQEMCGWDRPTRWSMVRGAGRRFANSAQMRRVGEGALAIVRQTVVVVLIFYPTVVRACAVVTICVTIGQGDNSQDRALLDFDVICGTDEHEEMIGLVPFVLPIFGFGIPVVLFCSTIAFHQDQMSIVLRKIFVILTTGFEHHTIWWQAWIFMRTLCLLIAGTMEPLSLRAVCMIAVLIVGIVVHVVVQPYEIVDHNVLNNFDLLSMGAIVLTILVGMMLDMEFDRNIEALKEDIGFLSVVSDVGPYFVIFVNMCVCLYAVQALLYNTLIMDLQFYMLQGSNTVDATAGRLHRFMKAMTRGMNTLTMLMGTRGQCVLDISKLQEYERSFVTLSLQATMSACIDSSTKFHTWLFDNAIREAFSRACNNRLCRLRNAYNMHGMNSFFLIRIGPLRLLRVSLRPPDVAGEGSDEAAKSEYEQQITVEEFHHALHSVNYDLLQRVPELFIPSSTMAPHVSRQAKHQHYLATWHEGASLFHLEDELQSSGNLDLKQLEEAIYRNPDPKLVEWFESQTEELRKDNEVVKKTQLLTEELRKLDEEVAKLQAQLDDVNGGRPEPSLVALPAPPVPPPRALMPLGPPESAPATARTLV